MSEPSVVLALRDLHRTYRSGDRLLHVLDGVELDLREGEIVGLVGPSGSGKSSLLHAAGLLERPTSGRVLVEGQDCTDLSDALRTRVRLSAIGFVYQAHHLSPEFTAEENVVLPQLMAGRSPDQAQARARALLGEMGLAERLEHQPAQMSGGEQQRVAVARALAGGDETAWRPLMGPVRKAAIALAEAGQVEILRKGKPVPIAEVRGVIRLRRAATEGET